MSKNVTYIDVYDNRIATTVAGITEGKQHWISKQYSKTN